MTARTKGLGKKGVLALVAVCGGAPLALLFFWGGYAWAPAETTPRGSVALGVEPLAIAPIAPSREVAALPPEAPTVAARGLAAPADSDDAADGERAPAPIAAAPTPHRSLAAAPPPPATATSPREQAMGADPMSALGALMDSSGARGPTGYGGLGSGSGTIGSSSARARPPLPSSGVLASTFVGGHGTASRLEDLMDRGVMVDGERVHLGAFQPMERLSYPVPADRSVALYSELERSRLREEGETVHMQIALVARNGERPARPRMDVRLVLDRSGSMDGEKWTNAVAAAHALVDHLRPGDTFGLVSYSDTASLDVTPARVGNGAAAHAAIRRLVPGGGTNIGAALDAVAAAAPTRRAPNDVLLVMLLSDGEATVGDTAADTLASRARAMFDGSGVVTTTLGVGTDFDENTMLSIAREGSGSYEFVRRSADIAPILTEELDERALAVAQDLRLRIELADGVQLARVYGSRVLDEAEAARVRATEVAVDERVARELGIPRDRQEDDQTGLRMHIPSFRRGDQHVVLLELVVPPGTGDTAIAHVSLDYKDLHDEQNAHAAVDVHTERTADAQVADESVRRPVKQTVLAFQAADTLRAASEALALGDAAGAALQLDERIALLEAASRVWHDPSMGRDARLLASYRHAIQGGWQDWDYGSRHALVLAMGYYGDQRME